MNSELYKTTAKEKLLLDIEAQIAKEGISNRKFAKKLNIPHATWQAIRNRKMAINLELLKAISRIYEGKFDIQILQFLRDGKE